MRIEKPTFIFDQKTDNTRYRYLTEEILYCIVEGKGKLEIKIELIEEGRAKGIPNMEVFQYHFNPLTNSYAGEGWKIISPDGTKERHVDIGDGIASIEFPRVERYI